MDDTDLRLPVLEAPKKKRGRPQKSTTMLCGCDVLVKMMQKPCTMMDYLDEFMDTAQRFLPKHAEEWCQSCRAGLRKDIRDDLKGVLEP